MGSVRAEPASELPQFLKRVPLFADLNDPALAILARVSRRIQIPKGRFLFHQNDAGDAAYVVLSGEINIILGTQDGRELVINAMHPGDCFGELALITGAPRSAGATACMPTELIVIPRDAFLAELSHEPKLMEHLVIALAKWLRASTEREGALAFLDAPTRLARVLLDLNFATQQGAVTISQEELAQRIGATRETTAKILGRWRRKGWIITGRGKLVVLDRAALKKVSDETNH